ncbi:hypothetical protein D3C87_1568930 [compost metagenome]
MVDHVMADFPQTVGRERRQERQPAEPFVQAAAVGQALVAGIVADDEQPGDHQTQQHAEAQLGPPLRRQHHAGQHGGEDRVVEREQRQRAGHAALAERNQPATDGLAVRERGLEGDGFRQGNAGELAGRVGRVGSRLSGLGRR